MCLPCPHALNLTASTNQGINADGNVPARSQYLTESPTKWQDHVTYLRAG